MTLTQDYDALMRRVCDDIEDWATRLILADCLEEMGRQSHADCMRWRVTWRKRPRRYFSPSIQTHKFQWYGQDDSEYDPRSDLPVALADHLGGGRPVEVGGIRREYDTALEAEEDTLQAWGRAIRGGWKPS